MSFFDPHAAGDLPIRCQPGPFSPRGAVAVVFEGGRFLVIRRSPHVVAPWAYCFPGGAIECGESVEEALVREIREELGTVIYPICRVWESVTPWGVPLSWWQGRLEPDAPILPNPSEVASVHWHTPEETARLPGLLESNLAFLEALASGQIRLHRE
jgi:(d)CTP diphosphatase